MTTWNILRIFGIVACCLLLAAGLVTVSLAESKGSYQVESGSISGGNYRVTMTSWRVSGVAGGGGYRLLDPAAPDSPAIGCCCTYLPCAPRQP